jgi:Family of unknown function (DUF6498)
VTLVRRASIGGVERLLAWYRVSSSVGAVVALVVANLIPLVGVLVLGWSVWAILILYWLENGVIGVFNVLKILRSEGVADDPMSGLRFNGQPVNTMAKAGLATFFTMHYGIFWVVHGIFVLTLPVFGSIGSSNGPSMVDGVDPLVVLVALVALTISHGVSYWFNYLGRGEYRTATAGGLMSAPYGRLIILHVTIIFGALAISMTGAPAFAVAILVGLKIMMDLGFHLAEHRPKSVGVRLS